MLYLNVAHSRLEVCRGDRASASDPRNVNGEFQNPEPFYRFLNRVTGGEENRWTSHA